MDTITTNNSYEEQVSFYVQRLKYFCIELGIKFKHDVALDLALEQFKTELDELMVWNGDVNKFATLEFVDGMLYSEDHVHAIIYQQILLLLADAYTSTLTHLSGYSGFDKSEQIQNFYTKLRSRFMTIGYHLTYMWKPYLAREQALVARDGHIDQVSNTVEKPMLHDTTKVRLEYLNALLDQTVRCCEMLDGFNDFRTKPLPTMHAWMKELLGKFYYKSKQPFPVVSYASVVSEIFMIFNRLHMDLVTCHEKPSKDECFDTAYKVIQSVHKAYAVYDRNVELISITPLLDFDIADYLVCGIVPE